MSIRNKFLSRLLAGLVVASVALTSVPSVALANEVEVTEAATSIEEETVQETEVVADSDKEISAEDKAEVEVVTESASEQEEFFEEMTEFAQNSLPTNPSQIETLTTKPYAKIQYANADGSPYVSTTKLGTIRFVTQNPESILYSSSYWNGWDSSNECGTTCHSMALSYLGVNMTPGVLLNNGGGVSRLGNAFGASGIQDAGYGNTDNYGSCTSAGLQKAINNYLNNDASNPKYSPVFFHVNRYPGRYVSGVSHYMLVIGQISTNTYRVLDPWDNSTTTVTFDFSNPETPKASYNSYTQQIVGDEIDEFYQFTRTAGSSTGGGSTTPTPTTPTVTDMTAVANVDGITLCDDLNVRKGPGTTYGSYGTIPKYKRVIITGKNKDWYRVIVTVGGVQRKEAYVSRLFVVEGKRQSAVSFNVKAYYGAQNKVYWTKQDGVTGYKVKRYNPSTGNYDVIATIKNNTTTSYMDKGLKSGTTYKYRVSSYKQYVTDKSYNVWSPESAIVSKKAVSYMTGTTTGTNLNVRKGPGTSYGILTVIKRAGTSVKVYDKSGDWYKIKISVNGVTKTGYITREFVKL